MPSRVVGMTRSRGVRVAEGEWRLVLTETVFRSEDVPAAERFECWRDLLRQLHAPLDLDSEHRSDFRAEQRVLELGEVSVWPTRFQPVRFLRTPKLIRQSDPEGVHLSLPLDGVLRVTRGDRETAYGPDSLCLVDTSRPLDLRAGDSFSPRPHIGVGLEVPKALLPLTWDRIDRLTACGCRRARGSVACWRSSCTSSPRVPPPTDRTMGPGSARSSWICSRRSSRTSSTPKPP